MKRIILTCFVCLVALSASAQVKMPPASPTFKIKGTVGLTEVSVIYSRPSAKGRKVAGELIPYDEVWRTGANASTKLSFTTDVKLEGNLVAAGTYALYTLFTEEEATVILSKNLDWWGAIGYDATEDVLRFKVPIKHPSSHYETFTISFSDFTLDGAYLNLKWEHTKVMFRIESEVDPIVMGQIKANVIDRSTENTNTLFQSASYYYETGRDSELALEWINKAIDLADEPTYSVFHLKAKLLARLERKKAAIEAAQRSIDLAKKAGNPDYVKLNEKLIRSMN